ncbi:MAG: DNA-directed RNA polymerase subunit beta [Lactobacillus sp.]|nr:DNA-directed RNA polymerase subunit beta [Agrilactobacillus composti]MCH4170970.1 DNA-directed RNA polymerase subunit beta [Lactobacillus sp.]
MDEEHKQYVRWVLKRILLLVLVAFILLIIGAMIGFKLGGGNPLRVFLPSTWLHIFSFFR